MIRIDPVGHYGVNSARNPLCPVVTLPWLANPRRELARRDLQQKDLAEMTGLSPQHISDLLHVMALQGGSGEVFLYFEPPQHIDEIRVYQGMSAGNLGHVRSEPAKIPEGYMPSGSLTISGLENETTYYFALTAVRFGYESDLSEVVSARPVPHSCWEAMQEERTDIGPQEEVDRYDSSDYHSHTWWYWSRGWSLTFTWGSFAYGCDISTYSFEPIP
jgi:hypothetical protein